MSPPLSESDTKHKTLGTAGQNRGIELQLRFPSCFAMQWKELCWPTEDILGLEINVLFPDIASPRPTLTKAWLEVLL